MAEQHDAADMLTPDEVAGLLKVSVPTVYAMCKAGRLGSVQVGVGTRRQARRIPRPAWEAYRSEQGHRQVKAINVAVRARAGPVPDHY